MARVIPDKSFYPSPAMAMSAPETLAYVAMIDPRGGSDALSVLDVDTSSKAMLIRSINSICRTAETSSMISAGTAAVRACARSRRTRTWSGGI